MPANPAPPPSLADNSPRIQRQGARTAPTGSSLQPSPQGLRRNTEARVSQLPDAPWRQKDEGSAGGGTPGAVDGYPYESKSRALGAPRQGAVGWRLRSVLAAELDGPRGSRHSYLRAG